MKGWGRWVLAFFLFAGCSRGNAEDFLGVFMVVTRPSER